MSRTVQGYTWAQWAAFPDEMRQHIDEHIRDMGGREAARAWCDKVLGEDLAPQSDEEIRRVLESCDNINDAAVAFSKVVKNDEGLLEHAAALTIKQRIEMGDA